MIPRTKLWKVTFHYDPPLNWQLRHSEWVYAPTKKLALWNARERAHAVWMIPHPKCVKETVSICRKQID